MKKTVRAAIYFACVLTLSGWGSAYGSSTESEKGYTYAETKNQKNIDDIESAQGDESARSNINDQGSQRGSIRGRW